jgi:hypothetical protein
MGKVSLQVMLCFVEGKSRLNGKSLKWEGFRRLQDSHLTDSYFIFLCIKNLTVNIVFQT